MQASSRVCDPRPRPMQDATDPSSGPAYENGDADAIDAKTEIASPRAMRNLITDVPGLSVGHATDRALGSGATAILFDEPAVAALDLRGGGPGTRETELLDPAATVGRIDAISISGGSAFGLESAAGIMAFLAEHNRGFAVGSARVPIVPGAILFDLLGPGERAEVLIQGGGSLLTAVLAYLAMNNPWVRHITFNFLGVQLILMSLILLAGNYTGYRLLELRRFKPVTED